MQGFILQALVGILSTVSAEAIGQERFPEIVRRSVPGRHGNWGEIEYPPIRVSWKGKEDRLKVTLRNRYDSETDKSFVSHRVH
jgi:hypothetical protein